MYVSRRRNLRHGGGILLSVQSMDIDAVHPIGSLLFSADKNYNPNNDEHLQGTVWAQIYYNGAIASTTYPNLVGYSTGENVATGRIGWDNLPEHTIVSTGTTTNDASHNHGIHLTTSSNGTHSHMQQTLNYEPNRSDGVNGRFDQNGESWSGNHCIQLYQMIYDVEAGEHNHTFDGTTSTDGNHSHNVSTTAIEGGYVDSNDEYHSEGKLVRLSLDPSKYNVFVWKRIE